MQTLALDQITYSGISIDSRTVKPGDLFVALKGVHFDGHDYVNAAKQKGAVAAIVSQAGSYELPVIQVANTHQALIELAQAKRAQFNGPVIGITGSCGKTTTRALCEAIFRVCGQTLASEGSFNNDIGLPLTMLKLQADTQYYVQELGANHAGEIAVLTRILQPDVAVLIGAAPVHLEGFGDVPGVARAKAEIFQGLPSWGVAVINADDEYADFWQDVALPHRIITFALNAKADVTAHSIMVLPTGQLRFRLVTPHGETEITLQLVGEHNVMNALAATSAAIALDIPLAKIKLGLEAAAAVEKRLNIISGAHNIRIINDAYNANPQAVLAALKTMQAFPGQHVLVLGEMRELGVAAANYHQQVGQAAREMGISALYCLGNLTQHCVQAFGKNGYLFEDKLSLIAALKRELQPNTTILVKGSKSLKMWEVVEELARSI